MSDEGKGCIIENDEAAGIIVVEGGPDDCGQRNEAFLRAKSIEVRGRFLDGMVHLEYVLDRLLTASEAKSREDQLVILKEIADPRLGLWRKKDRLLNHIKSGRVPSGPIDVESRLNTLESLIRVRNIFAHRQTYYPAEMYAEILPRDRIQFCQYRRTDKEEVWTFTDSDVDGLLDQVQEIQVWLYCLLNIVRQKYGSERLFLNGQLERDIPGK